MAEVHDENSVNVARSLIEDISQQAVGPASVSVPLIMGSALIMVWCGVRMVRLKDHRYRSLGSHLISMSSLSIALSVVMSPWGLTDFFYYDMASLDDDMLALVIDSFSQSKLFSPENKIKLCSAKFLHLYSAVAMVFFVRYTSALSRCFEWINSKATADIESAKSEEKSDQWPEMGPEVGLEEHKCSETSKLLENTIVFVMEVALSGFIFPQGLTLSTTPVLLSWGETWFIKTDHIFYCAQFLILYDTIAEFLLIPSSIEKAGNLFFHYRVLWCFNCVMLMCCIWKAFFFRDLLINLFFCAISVLSQDFSYYEKPNCVFTLSTMNYLMSPLNSFSCFQRKISCSAEEAAVSFLTLYERIGSNMSNFLVIFWFFSLSFVPFVLWTVVDLRASRSAPAATTAA